ncbi:hypothetical protein [Ichthyobacterium seriolicida]|nr:hypothetical protein [Ichthyobacterium seriolicida]
MNLRFFIKGILSFVIFSVVFSCIKAKKVTDTAEDPNLSSDKVITLFELKDSDNKGKNLGKDVSVTIDTDNFIIPLTVTHNAILEGLRFNVRISDNSKISPSAEEEITFEPVEGSNFKIYRKIFKVTAQDGSVQDYTVNVTKALSNDCSISSFVLEQSKNTNKIFADRKGVIDENTVVPPTITLHVSENADLNGLSPTIIHTGVSVSPAADDKSTVFTADSGIDYTVIAANGEKKIYKVIIIKDLKSSRLISFNFKAEGDNLNTGNIVKDITGDIDHNAKTVTVKVPYNAIITALTPEVLVNEGSEVTPKIGGGANTAQDFSDSKVYTIMAQDGTSVDYTVNVSKYDEPKISSFKFGADSSKNISKDITAAINNGTQGAIGEIVLKVPHNAELNELTPTVTGTSISGFSVYKGATGSTDDANSTSVNFSSSHSTAVQYSAVGPAGGRKIYNVKVYKEPVITEFKFTSDDNTSAKFPEGKQEYVAVIQQEDISSEGTITLTVENSVDISSLKPSISTANIKNNSISPDILTGRNFGTSQVYSVKHEYLEGYEKRYNVRITKEVAPKLTGFKIQANPSKGIENDVSAELTHEDNSSTGIIKLKIPKENSNPISLEGLTPIVDIPNGYTLNPSSNQVISGSIEDAKFTLVKNDTGTRRIYSTEIIEGPYVESFKIPRGSRFHCDVGQKIDHTNNLIELDFSVCYVSSLYALRPEIVVKNGNIIITGGKIDSYGYENHIDFDSPDTIVCTVTSTSDSSFTKVYTVKVIKKEREEEE